MWINECAHIQRNSMHLSQQLKFFLRRLCLRFGGKNMSAGEAAVLT